MFIDKVEIFVKSGDGGNGVVAFRREKFVPRGGPSGGDGGKGGDIIIKADGHLRTLLDFQYRHHFRAQKGEHGKGNKRTGKDGADLILKVPPGTLIKEKGKTLIDLVKDEDSFLVVKGGKGGRGNACFATSTNQAPKYSEKGEKAEEKRLTLELKLIAEAGLIGYPNSGKSTLLSKVSKARPKVADYPFTTLEPILGVVKIEEGKSFVLADIPGLIEGAHKGAGLGDEFLRHIERTKVLIHLVDLAEPDPVKRYFQLRNELELYNPSLLEKPEILVANKMDLPEAKENLKNFKKEIKKEVIPISALTGEGIKELIGKVWKEIS
ncbi:MAG: GTPase ObgE [Candidatus Omnitrophica bacterium]|nr:GTPase ObgE [Candidatus Omnitrophota bacterium]